MAAHLLSGCNSDRSADKTIAVVGGNFITRADLITGYGLNQNQLDELSEGGKTRLEEAARRWAMEEILIQEAMKLHLDQDSSFNARLNNVRRSLLTAILLETIYASIQVDTAEIIEEYERNSQQYSIVADQIKLTYVTAPDRNKARQAQRALQNGTPLIEILSMNDLLHGEIIGRVEKDDLSSEIANTAFTLVPGGISTPFKMQSGEYIVIQCQQRRLAGATLGLEEVANQIHGQIYLRKKLQAEKSLRDSLWIEYKPEIMVSGTD